MTRKPTVRLGLLGVVLLFALLPARGGAQASTAAAPAPAASSSFYVYGSFIDVCGPNATTECPLYNDGAAEAVPPTGGMTILDFGAPCFEPSTLAWGEQLFNSQGCTPDALLVMLAQAWLRGYQSNPNRSTSQPYVLALGTSNSLTAAIPGNALTRAQMALHAQAWFTSVVTLVATAAQPLSAPVTIWAGNDIEESGDGNWYDGATTAAWVDAYSSASSASKPCVPTTTGLMADFGDYVPNEPGWSPAAVYHVAWQSPAACAVPEIYTPRNADEWQSLNRYAAKAALPPIQFTAVLSQDGGAGTLTAAQSWTNLQSASGQAPPYLSAIGLAPPIRAEVPDAPTALTAVAGPGFVTLSWAPPAWDGGAAVTAYTVSVLAGSAPAEDVKFAAFGGVGTVMVTGLASATAYTFYVRATNRVGSGPRSLPSATVVPTAQFPLR